MRKGPEPKAEPGPGAAGGDAPCPGCPGALTAEPGPARGCAAGEESRGKGSSLLPGQRKDDLFLCRRGTGLFSREKAGVNLVLGTFQHPRAIAKAHTQYSPNLPKNFCWGKVELGPCGRAVHPPTPARGRAPARGLAAAGPPGAEHGDLCCSGLILPRAVWPSLVHSAPG